MRVAGPVLKRADVQPDFEHGAVGPDVRAAQDADALTSIGAAPPGGAGVVWPLAYHAGPGAVKVAVAAPRPDGIIHGYSGPVHRPDAKESLLSTPPTPAPATEATPVAWSARPAPQGRGPRAQPAPDAPSITVFFPAYNDGGTIASMVIAADRDLRASDRRLRDHRRQRRQHRLYGEVLDDLARALSAPARHAPPAQPWATAATCAAGFAAATKDLIFYTDGDAQYDPRELALLYPRLTARRRHCAGL